MRCELCKYNVESKGHIAKRFNEIDLRLKWKQGLGKPYALHIKKGDFLGGQDLA